MEEKKFIQLKKDEFKIKEFIKKVFGRGKISNVKIEYTPIGEKIIITTNQPGFIIGKGGEKIQELTENLKSKFKLENPHIDLANIENPLFDSQIVLDDLVYQLEKFGSARFKVIVYKMLEKIKSAGVLGAEIRLSGKLPSERARTWVFSQGYLKKTGEMAKTAVNSSKGYAKTIAGVIGVKVKIMPPQKLKDDIKLSKEDIQRMIENKNKYEEQNKEIKKSKKEKK